MSRSVAILAWILAASTARAQAPDLMALGRQEFQTAKREFDLGHLEKALEHFETSYRLTARAELLYNLGVVNRALFDRSRRVEYLQAAIERYRAYLASSAAADDEKRRAAITTELSDAEGLLAKERAARAQGEAALELGETFLKEGRFADAAAQVESYLRASGISRIGAARAAALQGRLQAIQKDHGGALLAFERALVLDRTLAPPDEPPARAAFEAARTRLRDTPPLSVRHAPPASLKPGAPITLEFAKSGDPLGLVSGLRLSYRIGGGRAYSTLPVQPIGPISLPRGFSTAVPPGARLEYFGVALGHNDALFEHLGTEAAPFGVTVEPRRINVAKKWWFWTALVGAAGAVAGGVALGVTLSQPAPPTEVPFATGLSWSALRVSGP